MKTLPKITIAASLAALLAGAAGIATSRTPMPATRTDNPAPARDREKVNEALTHVNKAVQVVRQMEGDRNMARLLNKSRACLSCPTTAAPPWAWARAAVPEIEPGPLQDFAAALFAEVEPEALA